ncbi:MAG TPA: ATP-binding protein [Candidatus Binatia bacterium]|nr:ATP-binding protein [Candidatus Binatia bacterium]
MPRRSHAKLRTALIALLIVAALPPIAAIVHGAWVSRRESLDDAAHEMLEKASEAAERLGEVIDEAGRVLRRLAGSPAVRAGEAAACEQLARMARDDHPSLRNIGVVRGDGTVLCSAEPPAAGSPGASRHVLEDALASPGLLLREFPPGTIAAQPVLAATFPVRDSGDRAIGVAFATVDFRELANLEIGTHLPPGSTVTLLDSHGEVVIREPDHDAWVGKSIATNDLWSALQKGDAATSDNLSDLDGQSRLLGYARIHTGAGQPDAFLVVGVNPESVTQRPIARFRIQIAILAAVLLILVGITWFAADAFLLRPVHGIESAAREIAAGKMDARSGGRGYGAHELARLGEAFDDMAESLERSLGETLHTIDVLRANQVRLTALSRALIDGQEAERSQIARELHDEVGQALTAVTMDLDALRLSENDAERLRRVQGALEVVTRALEQVRELSLDLHPSILDDLGLAPALKWHLARQAERAGIETELRTSGVDARLPHRIETACFRIAQEAITNALRHARPRKITVSIDKTARDVELRVRDDGFGFDAAQARLHARQGSSLGILGMEERAELLGGTVDIESRPGHGSEVRATIPLAVEEHRGEAA